VLHLNRDPALFFPAHRNRQSPRAQRARGRGLVVDLESAGNQSASRRDQGRERAGRAFDHCAGEVGRDDVERATEVGPVGGEVHQTEIHTSRVVEREILLR
jgi:hypothetical protein